MPVNLFLLLLLHLFLVLELVSKKRTSSRSERTTDERPRNRMVNGTTDKTPLCGSSQPPSSRWCSTSHRTPRAVASECSPAASSASSGS